MECSSASESRLAKLPQYLLLLLLLCWALGVQVGDAARGMVVLGLLAFLARSLRFGHATFGASLRLSLLPFVLLWLLLIALQQWANYVLGLQGFDFAIFSQAIESVSQRGSLATSFVDEGWVTFLSHHFSPVLYVPGLLGFIGLSGPQAAILFHLLCIAGALFLFLRSAGALGAPRPVAILLVLLLCLHPTFRVALSWEVHDELFALPFIGLAYVGLFERRVSLSLIGVLLACCCKENMFIFAVLFAALMWVEAKHFQNVTSARRVALGMLVLGLSGAVVYFLLLDFFIERTFDPAARIASMRELFDPQRLWSKAYFLLLLAVPLLGSFFWSKRALLYSLPAAAFLGPILLTSFDAMYHPYNYYGVVPLYILAFAALVALRDHNLLARPWPAAVALVLVALALSLGAFNRPTKLIRKSIERPWLSQEELAFIPDDAAILADDYSFSFLLDKERVHRFWTAERKPVAWEYLVRRRGTEAGGSAAFVEQAHICRETPHWIVYCRK